jgi:hypothetical protein
MPSVIGEPYAWLSTEPFTCTPALASANSGTITKLVQGCSRYCSRSFGEIADATPRCVVRASSGVGCSRNERVSSTTRSSPSRCGG